MTHSLRTTGVMLQNQNSYKSFNWQYTLKVPHSTILITHYLEEDSESCLNKQVLFAFKNSNILNRLSFELESEIKKSEAKVLYTFSFLTLVSIYDKWQIQTTTTTYHNLLTLESIMIIGKYQTTATTYHRNICCTNNFMVTGYLIFPSLSYHLRCTIFLELARIFGTLCRQLTVL